VLGGIMLGAISLLSSRPEAFLAFTIPTGLPAAVRFLAQSDPVHFTMGLLAALFTINILITTWQIYRTVSLTLNLRFENRELLENLQTAKAEAEALNQKLESRVEERTFELYNANNRLRAEIEQRKLAEDELLRARKLESLGVLAGGIAHDFNNFLTIVQGNAALAKLKLESGDPVDDTLEQIASACQRAASLASQLLTFGKGGAPVRRLVSTSRLIEEAVGLARAGANVSIDVAIEDNLWSAEVDASQISHALHNILLNARQAMPEGGLIEVRGENLIAEADSPLLSPGQYVRIAVRDYGCGIPSDTLPRVFDPYFTTKQNGAGLGLAAAYSIVAKHQGQITVQSKLGEGTTFCVYLPASERSPSAEPQTSRKLHSGSGRVLVMDDEESLRGLVTRVLEQLGYQVESANDGAGAIALYEAARASGRGFDAVLLDLTVPGGMGGVDAAAKLREIDPSVPLIVSSGYSEAPILSEFQTHGFDAVLRKPWTPAELSEVVKQVIQTGRQHTND
jgi:signal transduction histidine kinase/ActR/RegA family two-component response regulator